MTYPAGLLCWECLLAGHLHEKFWHWDSRMVEIEDDKSC